MSQHANQDRGGGPDTSRDSLKRSRDPKAGWRIWLACLVAGLVGAISAAGARDQFVAALPGPLTGHGDGQGYAMGYSLGALGVIAVFVAIVWAIAFFLIFKTTYDRKLGRYYAAMVACAVLGAVGPAAIFKYSPANLRAETVAAEFYDEQAALRRNHDNYARQLKALHLLDQFKTSALGQAGGLDRAGKALAQANQLLETHRAFWEQRHARLLNDLGPDYPLMRQLDQDMRTGPGLWDHQGALFSTLEGELHLLTAAKGRWSLRGDQMLFSNPEDIRRLEANSRAVDAMLRDPYYLDMACFGFTPLQEGVSQRCE
ncbi:MAG: hypothetical protein JWM33_2457 [Caulobacteraceae bacterium]|nr:hypothetical protein [Caulobacteraceae bacterium]